MSIPRMLIILGLALILLGVLWPWITRLGLGLLPGDIAIERDGFHLYIPLMTSLQPTQLRSCSRAERPEGAKFVELPSAGHACRRGGCRRFGTWSNLEPQRLWAIDQLGDPPSDHGLLNSMACSAPGGAGGPAQSFRPDRSSPGSLRRPWRDGRRPLR